MLPASVEAGISQIAGAPKAPSQVAGGKTLPQEGLSQRQPQALGAWWPGAGSPSWAMETTRLITLRDVSSAVKAVCSREERIMGFVSGVGLERTHPGAWLRSFSSASIKLGTTVCCK